MATDGPSAAHAPEHRITPRSLAVGFVLAVVLCAINSYLTLSFGVIEEGPTIAVLFFFALFLLSSSPVTTSELVIVATMGSAGGSLGFICNFFAAKAMTGAAYSYWEMVGFAVVTSLLGLFFVIPLRQLLIVRESLPWPGAKAARAVIDALTAEGDRRQPLYLALTCLLATAYVVADDNGGLGWVPSASAVGLLGLEAYGAAIAWAPFAFGGAYLMGLRSCFGFGAAAVVLLVMAPRLETPAAPHQFIWPGMAFLLASGVATLVIHWRLVGAAVWALTRIGRSGPDADDDPVLAPRTFAVFGAVVFIVTVAFGGLVIGLNLLLLVLLVIVGGLVQNIIAIRAVAQTAFNPARVMGVLLQGVVAAFGGSSAGTNVAGAGFVAGSGAQAGNLCADMTYGRWLGVPSRWQFWAQLATVLPCALVAAAVFTQIQQAQALSLDGGLPAPVAKMWAAAALIFDGRQPMPSGAMGALGVGAVAGVIYVVLEQNERLRRWLPDSIGFGLGLVLPIAYDLAFLLGGFVMWGLLRGRLRWRDLTVTTIAVGLIVAEGFGGVIKPILVVAGLL